jgi:hypothetical protein
MPTARVIRAHHHTAVFHDQHRIVSTDRPDVVIRATVEARMSLGSVYAASMVARTVSG